ncbi:MAG: hypothetical protein H0S79_14065 [Anaerolineaceae bacterium]|nr:hypothetical protein [Anaerolineaceae bacterium]
MKKTTLIATLFVLIALITACTPQATEEVAILTVNEASYTQSGLEALGTISVDYTGKDGVVTTYEGVLISTLLADAGADSGTDVTLTAADGYEASATVEELMACTNCIVGFDEGGLRTVMPDMSGKLNVKDLVSISVQ